jgi:hypothetical protein
LSHQLDISLHAQFQYSPLKLIRTITGNSYSEGNRTVGGFSNMVDLLLALAWLVVVLSPAILASCQPVVSDDGYTDFTADDLAHPQKACCPRKK